MDFSLFCLCITVYGLWLPQLGAVYNDDVPVVSQEHQ